MPRLLVTLFLLIFSLISFAQERPAWPKVLTFDKGDITFYLPQPDKFKDNSLTFDMAVGVKLNGQQSQYGALKLSCRLDIDAYNDTAQCNDFNVINVNFPALGDKQQKLKQVVMAQVANRTVTISKARLESLMKVAIIEKKRQRTEFNFEPPKIYFADKPSALIFIDGEPKLKPLKEKDLMQVINTAFVIILDNKTGTYYLYAGNHWMQSNAIDRGWVKASSVPAAISKLAGKSDEQMPNIENIIVSYKPAALIQFAGKPEFTPLKGTDLLYVANSKDNVFLQIKSQEYYLLLSGRWFKGKSLSDSGTWSYVPGGMLPQSFKKIAPDSAKAEVLASVPETEQATDAVIRNRLPQTAIVNKNTTSINVTYDGSPQFEALGPIKFAVNADKPVFDVDGTFYANYQGVWFESTAATGPWAVATKIPDAIYDIPPSNPYYYVTYNYVYGSQGDDVYVGYTPGYEGSYVYGDTVIYGTGYDYDGWVGDDYYVYPQTWGYGYSYSPYYGWYPQAPYARGAWFGAGFVTGALVTRHYWRHHHLRPYPRGPRKRYARNQYRQWKRDGVRINRPATKPINKQRLQRAMVSRKINPANSNALNQARRQQNARNIARANQRQRGQTSLQALDRNKLQQIDRGQLQQLDRTRAKQRAQQQQYQLRQRQQQQLRVQQQAEQRRQQQARAQAQRRRQEVNNVYAGRNGNVYRRQNNQWQRATNRGWQQASRNQHIQRQHRARQRSNQHYNRARAQVQRGGYRGGGRSMGGRGRGRR